MPINHSLTAADHATRVRFEIQGSDPINVQIGNPAQTWPDGCFIEVVYVSGNPAINLVPFNGSVNITFIGGNQLREGQLARVVQTGVNEWDCEVNSRSLVAGNLINQSVLTGGTIAVQHIKINSLANGSDSSVVIGASAGQLLGANANRNVIIGQNAADQMVEGFSNVIVGNAAGDELNSDGAYNVLIGDSAGCMMTDGRNNIMIGHAAGRQQAINAGGNIFATFVVNDEYLPSRAQFPYIQGRIDTNPNAHLTIAANLVVRDSNGGDERFRVDQNGSVSVNGSYGNPGYVLTSGGAGLPVYWAPGGGGNLDDLGDVSIMFTPAQGDVLTFNAGAGTWIALAPNRVIKPAPFSSFGITTGGSYNLGSARHHNWHVRSTSATTVTIVIQPDSFWTGSQQYFEDNYNPPDAGPMPNGGSILIGKHGTGDVVFQAGTGVTINTPDTLTITNLHGKATLVKVGPNTWDLEGNIGT